MSHISRKFFIPVGRHDYLLFFVALIAPLLALCNWSNAQASRPAERVSTLVASIDDDPDPAHADRTPAVQRLIEIGPDAVPAVLPLMLSDDETTRLRAQRVLEGVTLEQFGFRFGTGWGAVNREKEWRKLWLVLGNLNWRASEGERLRSVKAWVAWIVERRMDIAIAKEEKSP